MNADEIANETVKALRCHADPDLLCGQCPYWGSSDCGQRMAADSADLIEFQAAEIKRLTEINESNGQAIGLLTSDYEAKLSASQARERAAVDIADRLCEEVENCYGRETELTQEWRGLQDEKGEGNHMDKLKALNSIEIVDSSVSQGECEYVLAEISAKNIEILLNAGFTSEQIDEAMGDDKSEIDLSILAFTHTDAEWWDQQNGFTVQVEDDKTNNPVDSGLCGDCPVKRYAPDEKCLCCEVFRKFMVDKEKQQAGEAKQDENS